MDGFKFLGILEESGVTDEGKRWDSRTLELLGPAGTVKVRVTPEVAKQVRGLTQLAPVRIGFAFASGKFDRHYPSIATVEPVAAAAR